MIRRKENFVQWRIFSRLRDLLRCGSASGPIRTPSVSEAGVCEVASANRRTPLAHARGSEQRMCLEFNPNPERERSGGLRSGVCEQKNPASLTLGVRSRECAWNLIRTPSVSEAGVCEVASANRRTPLAHARGSEQRRNAFNAPRTISRGVARTESPRSDR